MVSVDMKKLNGLLNRAVIDVITTMTGFDVEDDPDCSQFAEFESVETIIGVMAVFGSIDAVVALATDINSSKLIVAYMTGIMPTDLTDEDVHDGMAELVNMLVGRVKADLVREGLDLSITSPFSISGTNIEMVFKDRENRICRRFIAGDVEMFLSVAKI